MSNMTYKQAAAVLRNPMENMCVVNADENPEVVLRSAFVEALDMALEALEKLDKIAPVGDVDPEWYEKLSELELDYEPKADGSAWYRADDVWACIEDPTEEA